ncbi:unnamed protein product [Amoebophrya sp. A120]|nr:unnamed protein product [Amoebophrya sp. A120]|eukprot:GSA120T00014222001.1
MTNFGSTQIQSVMLFGQRRLLPSCYSGSTLHRTPKQAYNRPHLPVPQYRPSVPCILCITSFSILSISILTHP